MNSIRRAFTLLEILIVIGIIAILMAILLPAAERVRHNSYKVKCATNLQQIGQALRMYTNDNHGNYPRTRYTPDAAYLAGTGGAASDPFTAGGPGENDLTSPLFLLLRTEKFPAATMICPYNDVNEFTAEPADPLTRSNFTDYTRNLGYSYANPYPSTAAAAKEYRLTDHLPADFAIMADLSPGPAGYNGNLASVLPNSPQGRQNAVNSRNHENEGQNVLFADGHAEWDTTVFAGPAADNIFTTQDGQIQGSPVNKSDCVLLPAQ